MCWRIKQTFQQFPAAAFFEIRIRTEVFTRETTDFLLEWKDALTVDRFSEEEDFRMAEPFVLDGVLLTVLTIFKF